MYMYVEREREKGRERHYGYDPGLRNDVPHKRSNKNRKQYNIKYKIEKMSPGPMGLPGPLHGAPAHFLHCCDFHYFLLDSDLFVLVFLVVFFVSSIYNHILVFMVIFSTIGITMNRYIYISYMYVT